MSIEATIFVWKLKKSQVTPTEKLILLSYADRADETGRAYPSVKRLVEDTLFDRKTIMKCLASIVEKKILVKTGQFVGRSNQVPVYKFPTTHYRENDDLTSPKSGTGAVFGTGTKSGTGTSPKSGTGTSPKSGTRNLPLEPSIEPPIKKHTKKNSFTIPQMLNDNPNSIPEEFFAEWIANRKKPITERVWTKTNKVMMQLKAEHNIEPLVVFERMLEKQWQGMEVVYFDDLTQSRNAQPNKSRGNDSFSKWASSDNEGTDYDQSGNVIDSFSL